MKEGGVLVDSDAGFSGGRVQLVRNKIYNVSISDIEGNGIEVQHGAQHVDIIDCDVQNTNGRWTQVVNATDVDIHGGRATNTVVSSTYASPTSLGLQDGLSVTYSSGPPANITFSSPTTAPIPQNTILNFYNSSSVAAVTTNAPTANGGLAISLTSLGTPPLVTGMISQGNISVGLPDGSSISSIVGTTITVSLGATLQIPQGASLKFVPSSASGTGTTSSITPIGSTVIYLLSGATVSTGMLSYGNAPVQSATLTNVLYPFGPFSERYAYSPGQVPIAGTSLAGQFASLEYGIVDGPSQNVRYRDISFENTLMSGYGTTFLRQITGSNTGGLCKDFVFEGNDLKNLPYDMLQWDASEEIFDPEMSVDIRNNRGHASQAPAIVEDTFAAGDINARQYNVGFRPSEVAIAARQVGASGPISLGSATQIWDGSRNGKSVSLSTFVGATQPSQLSTPVIVTGLLASGAASIPVTNAFGLTPGMISFGNVEAGITDNSAITTVTGNTITLSGTTSGLIPAGTLLSFYNPTWAKPTTSGSTLSGSTTINFVSVIGLQTGMVSIGNAGITNGTTVTVNFAANSVTLSAATTAPIGGSSTLSFYNPAVAQPVTSGASSGSTIVDVGSIVGLQQGMLSGGNAGITDGTAIIAFSESPIAITLSAATTATIPSNTALTFYPPPSAALATTGVAAAQTTIPFSSVVGLQSGMVSKGNANLPDGSVITNVIFSGTGANSITVSLATTASISGGTSLKFYNTPTEITTANPTNIPIGSTTLALASVGQLAIGALSGGNTNLPDGSTITGINSSNNTVTVSAATTTTAISANTVLQFYNSASASVVTSGSSTGTIINLSSVSGLQVGMVSENNSGSTWSLPDGCAIVAVNSLSSPPTVTLNASIGGSSGTILTGVTLYFYNPNTAVSQVAQAWQGGTPLTGQVVSATQTINSNLGSVSEISIAYWEQGIIVTPIVSSQETTYSFVCRP